MEEETQVDGIVNKIRKEVENMKGETSLYVESKTPIG